MTVVHAGDDQHACPSAGHGGHDTYSESTPTASHASETVRRPTGLSALGTP